MDNRQFNIPVDCLHKEEFIQAGDELVFSYLPTGFVVATAAAGCIVLAARKATMALVLLPFLILAAAIGLGLLYMRYSWRKFPKDVAFSFLIDSEGWQMTVGENYGGATWEQTPRLKDRSLLLLFCQQGRRGASALPKRCLTDDQLRTILSWYQETRPKKK